MMAFVILWSSAAGLPPLSKLHALLEGSTGPSILGVL
jgi:hypothetical protein